MKIEKLICKNSKFMMHLDLFTYLICLDFGPLESSFLGLLESIDRLDKGQNPGKPKAKGNKQSSTGGLQNFERVETIWGCCRSSNRNQRENKTLGITHTHKK